MKKCPICKKQFLIVGLKNHILNKAESETYIKMKDLFNYNKSNFKNISRAVLLSNMPHFAFVRRNTKPGKGEFLL